MANYSGFEQQRPFTSLIGGMEAGNQMQYSALKSEAMRDAMNQQKEQRAAMKTYAATGEDTDLKGVAPDLWMKLDEQQRKSVETGMKDFREISPYLTVDNYGPMREGFAKRNPNLAALWPTPDQMTDPNNLRTFVTRAADLGAQIEAQRTKAVGTAQVGVQKQQMQDITIPTMKLQQQQQEKMAGIQYNNQKSLQENAQTFQADQYKLNRNVQNDLKNAQTTQAREQHFFGTLRAEEQGLDTLYFKGLEAAEKEFAGATDDPGYKARIAALATDRTKLRADIHSKYSDWAKQYNIPWKSGQAAPATKDAGPSPGADANFDRAKATIDAMPSGPAKDSKMQQLIDRWQSLQGKK